MTDRSRGELEFDSEGGRGADTAGAQHAVREAELRADVARMKLTGDWAIALWGSTIAMALIVPTIRGVSHVRPLVIWAVGMALLLGVRPVVHRPTITRAGLDRLRAVMFAGFGSLLALQAAQDRGMASPILLGQVANGLVFAMTSPLPLRATWIRLVGLAVLGLSVNAAASPHTGLAVFGVLAATVFACVVLLAIGADAYWRLRRQVFARRLVGRYRLVERIGKGGMGEVWRATHPGLRRDVAIKILRSDRATPEQIARFEAEIAALSELSHPNIVRVYDSGVTDDGLCYFAMELLRGETLAARVRRAGPLDAETATSVMRQVGRALAEAHAHEIVHRDLTPDNVFLDPSAGTEHAKLIDFGIAARTTESTAVVAGTPAYMAPEQARGEAATPAADLYALGAVWYFALTGSAPFEHADASAAMVAHASAEIVPPSARAAAIPPQVDAVVTRCLAKDPAARFASARALDDAIGGAAMPLSRIAIALDPLARADAPEPTPAAVEDPEHRASYVRCATVLRWVLVLWLALGVLDLATLSDLPFFIGVRAAEAAILLACVLYLRRGLPSPGVLEGVRAAAFTTLAIGCALVAIGDTGAQSARVSALMIVIVAQGLAVPERLRDGLIRLGTTYAMFMATLWLGVAVRRPPVIDIQLFVQYAFVLLLTTVLMASVGHAYWSLRQQLFEQRIVGRYRLGHMLGAGGMGQVWTADHPGLGREVAVKLLRPGDASDELVARFETEIHALTELAHPHTVRVYDCGTTDDGYWFYVMERLHGATLTQTVRTGGVMPGKRAVRIARQIANALAEAHAAGIVHRDLKPDNLFLTTVGDDRDFVKVLDFGVAKRAVAHRLTQTGIAIGTPAFMAPEQALSREVDGRTDVYALGAVLFHMLAGRPPFIAESTSIVMLAHVHDEPPRVASVAVGVPAALDELIDRCLAKDPRDRPESMTALERELAAIERDYDKLPLAAAPSAGSAVAAVEAPTVVGRRAPDDTPRS